MALVGEHSPARGGIPHLHCVITARRGDAPAIGRPSHCLHSIGMPTIGEDVTTITGIPDLPCLIPRPRGDTPAIGRPPQRTHSKGMPTIGVEHRSYRDKRTCQPGETTTGY